MRKQVPVKLVEGSMLNGWPEWSKRKHVTCCKWRLSWCKPCRLQLFSRCDRFLDRIQNTSFYIINYRYFCGKYNL